MTSPTRAYKRWPAGSSGSKGGQFSPGPARNNGSAKSAQQDSAAAHLAQSLMGKTTVQQQSDLKELSNEDLKRLTAYMYSFKSSDPKVVMARVRLANEMAHRGYDVKDWGALGGGTSSNKDKGKPIGPSSVSGTPSAPAAVKNTFSAKHMSALRQRSALSLGQLSSNEQSTLSSAGWGKAKDGSSDSLFPPSHPKSVSTQSLSSHTISSLQKAGWVHNASKGTITPPGAKA